ALLVTTPSAVEPWIDPPVQVGAATVQVPPLPVTVRPPLEPVVSSLMPLAAPLDDIDWKVKFELPIVVFATLSAVPVVVASVLAGGWALRVRARVGVRGGLVPVERVTPPLRLMVAPVSLVRLMPCPVPPVSVICPARLIVPPVFPLTLTALAVLLLVI